MIAEPETQVEPYLEQCKNSAEVLVRGQYVRMKEDGFFPGETGVMRKLWSAGCIAVVFARPMTNLYLLDFDVDQNRRLFREFSEGVWSAWSHEFEVIE